MHPLVTVAMFFLLVATALTAPHMTWPEARGYALVAVVLGTVFGAIGMGLK